jgi:hypothetical protein
MVVHWPSPRLPVINRAFIRLNRRFYQNSGDVVQSDVPLVLMPVVGCWAIRKKLTILSGLPHLFFDPRWADRLGRDGPADEAGEQQHGRGEGEELSSNPSSAVGRRGSRTPSWSLGSADGRLAGPLFCPTSARAAAASWSQARAWRINLRGCVVADRARSFGHHGGGRALESCGLVNRGLERERRHSANAGHRHRAAAHLVVPGHRQHGPLQ